MLLRRRRAAAGDDIIARHTTGRSAASGRRDRVYRKVAWRLLPFLFVCYICAYLDRVNIGFAKLAMLDALGFSEAVYGFGAGVFFIGYFLFEIPSNLALHRFGARRTIARIMVIWGLVSAAMAWVETAPAFYLLRFLLGAAEAGFFPGVILYLTYWFPAARRGRMVALFATAVAVATVVGGPLSGLIMERLEGAGGWSGWQWLFVLEALPSVVFGLAALQCLPDRPADTHWLDAAERELIARDLAAEAAATPHQRVADGLRSRWVWLLCAIYFCFVMGLYGLNFWLPTILRELGYVSLGRIGLLSAVPFGVAALAMVAIAAHADRQGERRWHIVVPALAGASGLAASIGLAAHPALAIAALSLGAAGVLAAIPQSWSLATAFLGGGAAASGIALINSCGNLSGFVGPYAIGWIKETTGSTAAGVALLAAAVVMGALLVLRIPARLVDR
jgi:D-galactonate transporter